MIELKRIRRNLQISRKEGIRSKGIFSEVEEGKVFDWFEGESYDRYKLPWLVSIEGVHPLSGELRDNLLAKEFLRFTSSASVLRDSLSPNGFPCACLLMANEGEERSLRPRKGKKIVNGLARIPFFRSSD